MMMYHFTAAVSLQFQGGDEFAEGSALTQDLLLSITTGVTLAVPVSFTLMPDDATAGVCTFRHTLKLLSFHI